MDKMIGGFNDRAEIAANIMYPWQIDGNCSKQELFLEGATWAFNQIKAVLEDCADMDGEESKFWTQVIYGGLTSPVVEIDDLIVGERSEQIKNESK